MIVTKIEFPPYSGLRCLMMPFIQGDPDSVPDEYRPYFDITAKLVFRRGEIGYLTIDESEVKAGMPHRGARAKHGRALHTEAGKIMNTYGWGDTYGWGGKRRVTLDRDVQVMLANSIDGSCAIWNAEHEDTSIDGDIGHLSHLYPYENAVMMKRGEVHQIGILTPHESIPVADSTQRQFLRIVSSGVHGREEYFTENPKVSC